MKPVLWEVLASSGGNGFAKRRPKASPPARLPAPPRVEVVQEGAVLDQLERQAADLQSLQGLVAELVVERRGEQEALAAVAHEFRRLHENQQVLAREHDDAVQAEGMARAELVATGATVVTLRDQLLATREELHRLSARQLETDGELAAAQSQVAKLEGRLARANAKLRRMRTELQDASAPRWRRRRSAAQLDAR